MCLASFVLHPSFNHYLSWGLNSDSFHEIGEGHKPNSRGLYTHFENLPTEGGMTISNLKEWMTLAHLGNMISNCFFLVKVGTSLIRGDQKVGAKVVFSPRTGSGWNGWMTFFQVGEVLVFP